MVRDGAYGDCAKCGSPMTWTPFVFATDVFGCESVDNVLCEAPGVPLRGTSTREREKKMARMGYIPAGDKVGGARNQDGYKRSLFSYAGQSKRSA
jgi:hypothetical protein